MDEYIYIEKGEVTVTNEQKPKDEEARIVRNGGFALCRDYKGRWLVLTVMEPRWGMCSLLMR